MRILLSMVRAQIWKVSEGQREAYFRFKNDWGEV